MLGRTALVLLLCGLAGQALAGTSAYATDIIDVQAVNARLVAVTRGEACLRWRRVCEGRAASAMQGRAALPLTQHHVFAARHFSYHPARQ